MKKLLLMVCLLACSSSGVAADHIPSPPQDAKKLCDEIEQAATTDALKGLPPEYFMEISCDIITARMQDNRRGIGASSSECRGALKALLKAYVADYAPPEYKPQSGRLSCLGQPCSCRVTFERAAPDTK